MAQLQRLRLGVGVVGDMQAAAHGLGRRHLSGCWPAATATAGIHRIGSRPRHMHGSKLLQIHLPLTSSLARMRRQQPAMRSLRPWRNPQQKSVVTTLAMLVARRQPLGSLARSRLCLALMWRLATFAS